MNNGNLTKFRPWNHWLYNAIRSSDICRFRAHGFLQEVTGSNPALTMYFFSTFQDVKSSDGSMLIIALKWNTIG